MSSLQTNWFEERHPQLDSVDPRSTLILPFHLTLHVPGRSHVKFR